MREKDSKNETESRETGYITKKKSLKKYQAEENIGTKQNKRTEQKYSSYSFNAKLHQKIYDFYCLNYNLKTIC